MPQTNDIFQIDLIEEDVIEISLYSEDVIIIDIIDEDILEFDMVIGGYMYENDYNLLNNKPSINGVELINNKTFEQLGRDDISNSRMKQIVDDAYELIFGGN